MNYKPITSGIPWRGDEDYHIRSVLDVLGLTSRISPKWALITLITFVLFLYLAWKRSKWSILIGALLVTSLIIFFSKDPFLGRGPTFYLRYPFVNYWFLALAPKIATLAGNPYHEALYRIVPLLSVIGIVWVFLRQLRPAKTSFILLWGLCIATMPLVFYYSSILYLELPAVFLMTVVCLHIKSLLQDDFQNIRQNPAWYALIMIGFIKETAMVFLFCFLACRLLVSWLRRNRGGTDKKEAEPASKEKTRESLKQYLAGELVIIFCSLFPSFLYLLFRSMLAHTRSFSPEISGLGDISVYYAIGRSLVEQFSLFLFFFLAGCFLLISKREFSTVSFFLLIFLVTPLFYAVDQKVYAGYSRFNLFILPSILAGSNVFIKQIIEQKKMVGISIVCIAIVINFLITPIYPDGTKKPTWGNYLSDISEHYYPYPEALAWLKEKHGTERIFITGLNYPYYFDFYFQQLNWYPDYKFFKYSTAYSESAAVSRMLAMAEKGNYPVVLYHVLGEHLPQPQETWHFQQEKVIKNDAHILVIYVKTR